MPIFHDKMPIPCRHQKTELVEDKLGRDQMLHSSTGWLVQSIWELKRNISICHDYVLVTIFKTGHANEGHYVKESQVGLCGGGWVIILV